MSTYQEHLDRKQHELNEAVDRLSDAVNDMSVKADMICRAFLGVHPYLLNQIGLGLLKAVAFPSRHSDGRICGVLKKAAEEVWG